MVNFPLLLHFIPMKVGNNPIDKFLFGAHMRALLSYTFLHGHTHAQKLIVRNPGQLVQGLSLAIIVFHHITLKDGASRKI